MRKNIKLVSAIMAFVMITFCLTACGTNNTVHKEEAGKSTEENSYIPEMPGIEDPNMPIDPGADIDVEPTTNNATSNGQFTYTLYGETVSMDVNIEDYLGVNSVGTKVFYLPRLLFDLGWYAGEYKSMEELGNNNFPKRWWYYADNDLAIYIDAGKRLESGQFNYISVEYIVSGSLPFEKYYNDDSLNHSRFSCLILDHTDECEYVVAGGLGSVSYNDMVLITYILWSEAENPGNNVMLSTFGEDWSYNGPDYVLP